MLASALRHGTRGRPAAGSWGCSLVWHWPGPVVAVNWCSPMSSPASLRRGSRCHAVSGFFLLFPLSFMFHGCFFFFFPFVFHLSQNVDIRLADRPCQMLGVLGGRSAPPTATLLNERDRGPQGLLASPGRKTPLMLWFVTPAFMSEPCLGPLWFHPILVQTVGLVSASAFSRMWELPHVSSWRAGRGCAGLGGDATPHSKQKYSLSSSVSFPVVFWVLPGAAAGTPASSCPCFWLKPGEL